ncbi:unnamed protein product [Aphanomyces euteiches]|uniref:YCII-related domain-containing protein n=1 Tax=Aphanomyces euteiches TaxID=100861 RepID=A0A6G0X573_9STRA|nr:hypothetical protein Ae201684_008319 [Aphanomyces euteiches]KAH9070582.1 hypothetical protein Ae201684P_002939 [Aphanomyces euteiches]KAH9157439.1 hypothetical protein AeRB84_000743 [Aphanomyces euteiches]
MKRFFSTSSFRPLWMLRYNYVEGMVEKRDPFRSLHLAHVEKFSVAGQKPHVVMGGAFADPVNGAAFVIDATSADEVREFAKNDPYVIQKLVTHFDVRPYNVVEFK